MGHGLVPDLTTLYFVVEDMEPPLYRRVGPAVVYDHCGVDSLLHPVFELLKCLQEHWICLLEEESFSYLRFNLLLVRKQVLRSPIEA